MFDDVKEFFDRFVEDLPSFDGAVIGNRYTVPYLAVSSDGEIWQCSERSEVVEYFQSLLDRHVTRGVLSAKYEDLECMPIGKSCFLATVTWTMMGAENSVISKWRESYNLIKKDSGLKIFTSIDH